MSHSWNHPVCSLFRLAFSLSCILSSFFFCHACGMWKFPGQGSNPHHSSYQSHSSDKARSLTRWATREQSWKFWYKVVLSRFNSQVYLVTTLTSLRYLWVKGDLSGAPGNIGIKALKQISRVAIPQRGVTKKLSTSPLVWSGRAENLGTD